MRPPPLEDIVKAALDTNEQVASDLLTGMAQSLALRGSQNAPESWNRLHSQLKNAKSDELRSVGLQLSLLFGNQDALENMRQIVMNQTADVSGRRTALRSLLKIDNGLSPDQLHHLVDADSHLRSDALTGLLQNNDERTANVLLQKFPKLSAEEKGGAIAVLVTRRQFATELLAAIDSGVVARSEVSAFALQQLKSYRDSELQEHVAAIWFDDDTSALKADEIVRLKRLMSQEYLQAGDAAAGRFIFDQTCSKCHSLFGEGGTIAPDLTGSGRREADYVIRNLVDPDEQIDPAYRQTTVITVKGRLFNGFIVHQDDHEITIRTQETTVRLDMKDVEEVSTSSVSMMPEGMLRTLTDEQFRDLLVYLASEDQVSPNAVSAAR